MSKIDKMKKALERLTVPVAERSDMETFITEYTENVLHKDFMEYHLDGKTFTREGAMDMWRSMGGVVVPPTFLEWTILSEDDNTVVIERGDSEDPTIKRKDQYTFKDGLLIEKRCLA